MRIFLDTNVLASALATRGLCTDLLQALLSAHDLVTSQSVLDELRLVLSKKFRLPKAIVDEFLDFIRDESVLIVGAVPIQHFPITDRADERILSEALAGQTDLFVTGDQELIVLAQAGPLPIVSPRGAWDYLAIA